MYLNGNSGKCMHLFLISLMFEYGIVGRTNVEAVDVSLKTSLQKHLDSMNAVFDKATSNSVSLSCKTKASKLVLDWYPTSGIQWKHNGENLELKMERMTYSVDKLSIQNLVPSDSGIYTCDMLIRGGEHLSVALYSLVVDSKPLAVTIGEPMSLECHSTTLGKLFAESVRQWLHGDKKVGDSKPAADTSEDTFPDSTSEYSGTWYCEVQDPKTGRSWKTARYRVEIKPKLPFLKRWRNYSRTNRRASMTIIASCCFGTVMLINIITSLLDKLKARKSKEMDYLQKALGMDGIGPDGVPLIPKGSKVEGENAGSESSSGSGSSSDSSTSSTNC